MWCWYCVFMVVVVFCFWQDLFVIVEYDVVFFVWIGVVGGDQVQCGYGFVWKIGSWDCIEFVGSYVGWNGFLCVSGGNQIVCWCVDDIYCEYCEDGCECVVVELFVCYELGFLLLN